MINVLFVCLGNICRSPTAHGVFEHLVQSRGLAEVIHVESAGTGNWHVGHAPDERSMAVALKRGIDLSHLRAEHVNRQTAFKRFHYVLAMDKQNLLDLQTMVAKDYAGELALFLSYDEQSLVQEVPDPYYGEGDGFELVLDLIESASQKLLDHILKHHLQTIQT